MWNRELRMLKEWHSPLKVGKLFRLKKDHRDSAVVAAEVAILFEFGRGFQQVPG
jgi:hypothetical protein